MAPVFAMEFSQPLVVVAMVVVVLHAVAQFGLLILILVGSKAGCSVHLDLMHLVQLAHGTVRESLAVRFGTDTVLAVAQLGEKWVLALWMGRLVVKSAVVSSPTAKHPPDSPPVL